APLTPGLATKVLIPGLLVGRPQPADRAFGHSPGLDSQRLETVALAEAVELERLVVIAGEGLAGHEVEHQTLQAAENIGQPDDNPPKLELVAQPAHDIDQGPLLGAAQLVDPTGLFLVAEHAHEGLDHVADEDRGELRV